MSNNLCPLLKKNKSIKYYINQIFIAQGSQNIKTINNYIEFKKKYKIKNHIKNNKNLLKQIKYKIKIIKSYEHNNIITFYNLYINKQAINKNYNNIYYKNHINRAQYYIISLHDINKKYFANKKLK